MDPQSDVAERTPARLPAADDATAGPVFVDLSGRRARLLRQAGVVAGAAVIGYTAVLGTGFSGGTAVAPDTLAPGAAADRDAKDIRRGHPPARKPSPGKASARKPSPRKPSPRTPSATAGAGRHAAGHAHRGTGAEAR